MRLGTLAALSLGLGGVAIAARPEPAMRSMGLSATTPQGVLETSVGLGGTFAALGLWAALRGTRDAYTAVGVTCLGAAGVRAASLRNGDPTLMTKALLAGELAMGVAGLAARPRRKAKP
jgi:hypothetical protein